VPKAHLSLFQPQANAREACVKAQGAGRRQTTDKAEALKADAGL